MDNYLKGIDYEYQIKRELKKKHKQVYLWSEIPIKTFINSRFFTCYRNKIQFRKRYKETNPETNFISDTGCDIYYYNDDTKMWKIVQCKNYVNTITYSKMTGFAFLVVVTKLNGELFYTSNLSESITRYLSPDLEQLEFNQVPYIKSEPCVKPEYKKLIPFDYQLEALEKMIIKKRGVLYLPCGMGKTLVAIMWAQRFDIVILFSPLIQHALQNLQRFEQELCDTFNNFVLVDSDGDRNVDHLRKKLHEKTIFSSTYKSADVIKLIIPYISENKRVGIVIDEFHNMSKKNMLDKNDNFYQVLSNENYDYLFLSATPKIYDFKKEEPVERNIFQDAEILENNEKEIVEEVENIKERKVGFVEKDFFEERENNGESENSDKEEEDEENFFEDSVDESEEESEKDIVEENEENFFEDGDDEREEESEKSEEEVIENLNITGEIEYSYEFGRAIQNGFICDYDVFVPDITISKEENLKQVYEYLNINDKTTIYHDAKSHFIIRGMEENGHSKCICYCDNIKDAKNMMQSLQKIKEYHCLDLYTGIITSETPSKQRSDILTRFQNVDIKAIICSVRILDECIDIPKCDSIFLSTTQSNQRRTIQRICRSNRKDPDNPDKKSGIYVWADEYKNITQIVVNLKQFDSTFTKEKFKIYDFSNEDKLAVYERCEIEKDEIYKKYLNLDNVILQLRKIKTFDESFEIFAKFVQEFNRLPRYNEVYNDFNINHWFSRNKSRITSKTCDLYIKFSNINSLVREVIDKFLEYKETNIGKKISTFDESVNLLMEYIYLYNTYPKYNIVYKDYNLGKWCASLKKKIISNESKYYVQFSNINIIKDEFDKHLMLKETKHKKLSFDQAIEIFKDYIYKYKKTPTKSIVVEKFNLGKWYMFNKKEIVDSNCLKYKKLVVIDDIVKSDIDRYLKSREENKGKKIVNFEQGFAIFKKYFQEFKKIPRGNKVMYENINIATWFCHQKEKVVDDKCDIYILFSSIDTIVKDEMDKCLERKGNLKGKKIYSFDESLEILKKYVKKEKKIPVGKKIIFENYNIGIWYKGQKYEITDINHEKYIKLSSIDIIVKQDLDNYLLTKNETKKMVPFETSFNLFVAYIFQNKKIPRARGEIYNDFNIGKWFADQKGYIKDKTSKLYLKFSSIDIIVKNEIDKYISEKNTRNPKISFETSFETFTNYIIENKKIPTRNVIYNNIKLGSWFSSQKIKIKDKTCELYLKFASIDIIVKNEMDRFLDKNNIDNE